ncbi:tRNA (5-methylaminomethyl-2-thiouridine)(34)-methyltransferase MnmD [Amaricoccus macauensis]|uniref:tRNA (5-methylaminomethyl-2-thiouridine)(34)-methyltransferase MnmD n=1 Tax=Amaricoccus macauensis TaxID=57001 RepID=UPI003C79D00B
MFACGAQKAEVTWQEGDVPVSVRFADPYFALGNGLAETRHVFLAGNDLPERFRPGFQIAELGFGTGLNALAAAQAWNESGQSGHLNYTSFEAFPIGAREMERALSVWPELAPLAEPLVRAWGAGARFIELLGLRLTVVEGDAREMLTHWTGRADAWFLDGFSPSRNPELWEEALLADVAAHTPPGGTFATYSAASAVRNRLSAAGFEVERVPGFGRKRHMTRGRQP